MHCYGSPPGLSVAPRAGGPVLQPRVRPLKVRLHPYLASHSQYLECKAQAVEAVRARASKQQLHAVRVRAADPTSGSLFISGGFSHAYQQCMADVWTLDTRTGSWSAASTGERRDKTHAQRQGQSVRPFSLQPCPDALKAGPRQPSRRCLPQQAGQCSSTPGRLTKEKHTAYHKLVTRSQFVNTARHPRLQHRCQGRARPSSALAKARPAPVTTLQHVCIACRSVAYWTSYGSHTNPVLWLTRVQR